jgi:citrate synthase
MTNLGLEIDGTILGHTRLSEVDGEAGQLSYCGYDLHDLVTQASWEEVVYLLWHEALPTTAQLASLHDRLAAERTLTTEEIALLRSLPKHMHGMDGLRTAVSALASLAQPSVMQHDHLLEEGIRLTAKLPAILATWIRLRNGQEPVAPNPQQGQAFNFLLMLNGTPPDEVAVRALDAYMVILAENGLNISTFVACVIASTQNDLVSAITAAIATLKGLAHGGANEYAMRTFLAIGTPERAAEYIDGMVTRKERLMGVGHRVFAVEDPRMRHMRQQSQAMAKRPDADGTMHAVAERVAEVISTHPYYQQRRLYPNVEFFSAPLLHQFGFPVDCFTAVFACARTPGWIAHIREQLTNRRLVRPEAAYVGEVGKPFVPIAERNAG